MLYRLKKFIVGGANVYLLWLTIRLLTGHVDGGLGYECLALSGFWLAVTAFSVPDLFDMYFDPISRVRFVVPMLAGIALSAVACWAGGFRGFEMNWASGGGTYAFRLAVVTAGAAVPFIYWGGLAEIGGWLVAWFAYRRNTSNFYKTSNGLIPFDVWLNPRSLVKMAKPGDMILSCGMFGAFSHAEVVFLDDDGVLKVLSVWMVKGTCVHTLEDLESRYTRKDVHYVLLRLRKGFSPEQLKRAPAVAREMLAQNRAWAERTEARLSAILRFVPIPGSMKKALVEKFATGFDPFGVLIGLRSKDHWTCIASCMEFYSRLGVKMRPYGTGLLGLGTGLLDPIQPKRFLRDPYFQVANQKDKALWEQSETLTPVAQTSTAC